MINIQNKDFLLNSILEYCDDLITIKDVNLKYIACNKAFLKHIGAEKDSEIVGKSVYEVFSPINAEILTNKILDVINSGNTKTYVFKIDLQGKPRIVKQISSPIIKDGKVQWVLSISSDVTQEENLKLKLVEKISQLNTILEYLPINLYMKNAKGEYILGTKYAKNFVENGVDVYSGINFDIEESKEQTLSEDSYVLTNKKPLCGEKTTKDSDGKTHWYKFHKVPILLSNNDVSGLITIVKNIDNEKILENRKSLFLATLSHDLKNPLLAQISSLDLFSKGTFGELNETQKEIIDLILESSQYMRDMLYSLLKAFKDNHGSIKFERQNFDVYKLISKIIKEMNDLAVENNIKINFESTISDNNKMIYADEIQLRRVVGNILNNAISYGYKNTEINIKMWTQGQNLKISFENTSDIIPDDLKNIIFDKYVCGKNVTSGLGIGLGLYFCKKVLEAHEGNIHLETNGNHNKFVINLPMLDENTVTISEIVL